jgi:hypothetical protein
MNKRKSRYFLMQSYSPFVILFLLMISLAQAQGSAAGTTPPAVISGRVTGYSSSGSTQGLAGIQVTAYSPVGIAPIEQAMTNANGNYILNLNLTGWQEIYLCAQDPDNKYVTECYDEHYWLYSVTGQWGEGDKIGIAPNQSLTRDFKLCQAGSIPITIDMPHTRGCIVFLEGTVNYKSKISMTFPPDNPPWLRIFSTPNQTHYSVDLADYILDPSSKIPIPPGNYNVWVEDSAQFFYNLEISDSHLTYSTNPIYSILPQNKTAAVTCDKPKADPLYFGSFARAGMIYGIITDPNTKEKTSRLFRVVTEGWHGKPDLVIGSDPNHNPDPANPQITYLTEDDSEEDTQADKANLGVKGIQVEIIPVNNKSIDQPIIPAKVTSLPDSDANQPVIYHTGSYGGYAFKFLNSGGYKIRAFSRVGNSDVFSIFYGNAYTAGSASVVSLGTGESKKIDFTLKDASISGKVVIQGGQLTNVSASLLTKAHEQICFTLVDSSTGTFSFHGLFSGDVVLRLDKSGYGVVEQSLASLKLGEQRNVGTVTLTPYKPCQGNGIIHGRVYVDENPQAGLANITVHAMDINHIGQASCSATTDAQGNFIISHLPSSGFIVYTYYDPNIFTEGYFNEMYKNVTAFTRSESWCQWEVNSLGTVLQNLNPSHMDDPNILITPIYITSGDQEVNIGLSTYNYPYLAGLNLFAYPGTPLKACDTAEEFLKLFTNDDLPYRISIRDDEKGGDMLYVDPNSHSLKGNDFPIESGHGYIFYLNTDLPKLQIPPFTIVPPPPVNLAAGRNIVSVPDGPDKGFYAQDVLRTFGDNDKDANLNSTAISNFDGRQGKWKSSAWFWGKCAGDNFKIERSRGYLADIKKTIVWSRKKTTEP